MYHYCYYRTYKLTTKIINKNHIFKINKKCMLRLASEKFYLIMLCYYMYLYISVCYVANKEYFLKFH